MDRLDVHGGKRFRGGRGLIVLTALLGATLLACPGQAAAQTTPDSGAVDQYVEDVPTASGAHVPGQGKDEPADPIEPAVQTQIEEQGGSDAPALTTVASSADYGAGPKLERPAGAPKADAPTLGVREGEIPNAAPEADVSKTTVAASAVSAAQGVGAARLAGFLLVLFAISVATLAAAARRRPGVDP